MDRSSFSTEEHVQHIWTELSLPESALASLVLPDADSAPPAVPSSFKIGQLAQASIALSALSAALVYAHRSESSIPKVAVPLRHAILEFESEKHLTIDGKPVNSSRVPIGGLHKTADGYVRVHDSFPNHREGVKTLLGLQGTDDREEVARKLLTWRAIDFETASQETGLAVAAALRSFEQWDMLPQAKAIADFPILIRKISDGPPAGLPRRVADSGGGRCLRGLRVVEMTRVIAAPVAGKTLAAHGADVLWVTSPNLPDLPELDRDMARGKRRISLDIATSRDAEELSSLLRDADVFIQSYRPGSLAAKGFSPDILAGRSTRNGIICANLSAYGPHGPWYQRRGFDSLVQTCSGMNTSEAEHYDSVDGAAARPTPCQALDHASGYFLAAGINAALYRRATEGSSWEVDVSLAGTMKYLRSMGQYEAEKGFEGAERGISDELGDEWFEERDSGFGRLRAVRHSASVEGVEVGWGVMPEPLGSDEGRWLD